MKVYATYIKSPIGWIELRATETHLIMARWVAEPSAEREESVNPILQETIWQLEEYFEGKRTSFDLPLQQEGTPFQQRVWEELQLIPYGKQISYQELAKRAGNTKAYRAAGSANGKNQIFIIVPCHRVIATNGALTGYAGGLKNKQALLQFEAGLPLYSSPLSI